MQDFPTEKVLELAFAAYRINGGYVKQTQRFSEGQPTVWSNKELVTYSAYYYNQKDTESDIKMWIPEDFLALKVTDEDRAAKDRADLHMRRYTMLALGKLSDFENDIFTAYSSEQIPVNRIGLLAYIPQFVDRELEEKTYKARLKADFADSKPINLHTVEDTTVEILKKIPLREYETNLYFGGIGKDLVCFTKKDIHSVGDVFEIRARVRNHDQERETRTPMTRLNYVKLKKVEQ